MRIGAIGCIAWALTWGVVAPAARAADGAPNVVFILADDLGYGDVSCFNAASKVRTGRIDALTFGLGSGIAGLAGVALSQIDNVSPNLGQSYIIDSFLVVVFGGVGNLWGTLVGALTLGVANKFLEPYAGAVLGKIALLVLVILFIQKRPRGLFALKGRAVEA